MAYWYQLFTGCKDLVPMIHNVKLAVQHTAVMLTVQPKVRNLIFIIKTFIAMVHAQNLVSRSFSRQYFFVAFLSFATLSKSDNLLF